MSLSYTLNETGNITMSTVLSVRLSDEERALLEATPSQAHTNVSDFVRRKALVAAELDMTERRVVSIPSKDWERHVPLQKMTIEAHLTAVATL